MKGCGRTIGKLPCCTVIHGDCKDHLSQIPPGSIDLVLTDPPYGSNAGRQPYKSRQKHHRQIVGDDQPYPVEIIEQLIKLPRLASYLFCVWDNLWEHGNLPKPHSVVAWVKGGGAAGDTGGAHAKVYEMVMFYRGRDWSPGNKFVGRPPDVIWSPRSGNHLHATQKPQSLIRDMLMWYDDSDLKRELTVLDPFMGSGTTGVVAKKLRKHFLGFEIDKQHWATAVHFINRTVPVKKHAPDDNRWYATGPGTMFDTLAEE